MNVILFRNRIFADVIKLRCDHTGLGSAVNLMTGILKGKPCEDTRGHTGSKHVKDWSDVSTSQEVPKIAGNHQKPEGT